MSKIKLIYIALAALLFVIAAAGCGRAIALDNTGVDSNSVLYYNGSDISGVSYSEYTVNPALPIPEQTGIRETTTPVTDKKPGQTSETSDKTDPGAETVQPPHTSEYITTQETVGTVPDETTSAKPQTEQTSKRPYETSTAPKPSVPNDSLPVNNYTALNHSEIKGIWISYFELYPILTGKSEAEFAKGISKYYDNAKSLGINTVFVHVRPYGDAMYKSEYFPWSKYCTGYIGEDPGFDPLEIMIDEAHKRSISFHAWVNPLRYYHEADAGQVDDRYTAKQWYNDHDGDYIVKVNGYWYLNPAYKQVTDYIALGVSEIVSGYDVDGVHIDDYFYPTTEGWFDSIAYNASDYSNLSQFRLDNCTRMVESMYNAVKSHNPTALFGISTQGNVTNNVEELYADVKKWCAGTGYCDYMAPQIYYGFENSGQPFAEVVDEWDSMLRGTGKKLIPGLAVYKIGNEDTWAGNGKYEWINNIEIIKRQIEKSRSTDTYSGIILYSYQFVFEPDSSVSDAVSKEIAAFAPLLK